MNLDRLMTMISRLFVRKAINAAMTKGIDMATRGTAGRAGGGPATPADAEQARKARGIDKRARQAARLTRRLGR